MIDRDGKLFSVILNFLRRSSISLSRPRKELEDILAEAEFYQIEALISMIKDKLSSLSQFEEISKIFTSCDKDSHLKYKESPEVVFHLTLPDSDRDNRGNLQGTSSSSIRVFRALYRKYNDVFRFSLELASCQYARWFLFSGGKQIECPNSVIFDALSIFI